MIEQELVTVALMAIAHSFGQSVHVPAAPPSPTQRACIVAELEGLPTPTESFENIPCPDWVFYGPSDSEARGFELASEFKYDGAEEPENQPNARHQGECSPHAWKRLCS